MDDRTQGRMRETNDHSVGVPERSPQAAPPSDAAPSWPPAGLVDRHEAAAMFGVSWHTWKQWIEDGKVTCGRWFTRPGARRGHARCKLYPVAELERLKEQMRASGCIYGEAQQAVGASTPEGFVERDEAARILGIKPDTLALFFTDGRICCGTWIKGPGAKRRKVYPLAGLRREMEAMEAARPKLPEGYVDVDGACAMFGVTKAAWIIWQREGKAPRGEWGRSTTNKPCRIYAVDELIRLKDEMRGADKVFREGGSGDGRGEYHIPEGWLRLQDACALLGVHENTWNRWVDEGVITFGERFTARKLKLYPLDEVKRLLEEFGKYSPPYPDPQRPACYRIPLAGERISRREAIIDAQDLPLVRGKRFHWSGRGEERHAQVATFNPEGETRLHQIIMGVAGGSEFVVSHRNDDPLDCRRSNLIVRTRTESAAAKRKQALFCGRPCTSRFKGVCLDKKRGKWVAYIKKDRVSRSLGRFSDEIAAAQAYDEAARELFGEHARLNFPDGVDAWLETEAMRTERAEAA
ncbi:MAG: helix-turn-helix domain-containing protein [Tepidisphaeraceae bacterium]